MKGRGLAASAIGVSRLVAGGMALAALPIIAWTYPRYNDGCQDCPGNVPGGGYSSASTGAPWPDSLHEVHRSSSFMGTDCDLCHRDGDNFDPYLNQSNGTGFNQGYGCVGCHGSPVDAGAPSGESLQRHHVYAGVNQCLSCHSPSVAGVQESQTPPYYGTPDTNVASSCDDDVTTSEDWNDDVQGLDNDGDLLYDSVDPGCQAGFVFHDGFVSGDTAGWSSTTTSQ